MKKCSKTIIIWVVFFSIGAFLAILLKNKFAQPFEQIAREPGSIRWDMLIVFPAFLIMIALPVMGYFLSKRIEDDI